MRISIVDSRTTFPRATFAGFLKRYVSRWSDNPVSETKALRLLWDHLTVEQRRQAFRHGWFEVKSSWGGTFRIGMDGSISTARPDRVNRLFYCCETVDEWPYDEEYGYAYPPGDEILMRKMMIESASESEFKEMACG